MELQIFRTILAEYILPMFAGAVLTDRIQGHQRLRRRAFLKTMCQMEIRYPYLTGRSFFLTRSQPFAPSDADFVQNFVDLLYTADPVSNTPWLEDLINPFLRRAVASQVAKSAEHLVSGTLAQFEHWADQTYEGRRIAAAVGIGATPIESSEIKRFFSE